VTNLQGVLVLLLINKEKNVFGIEKGDPCSVKRKQKAQT
jgi:hypothetical protein